MVVSERMVVIGDKFGTVDDSDRVATPMYESSVLVLILNLKYFCECFTFSQHFFHFDRGFTPFRPGSAKKSCAQLWMVLVNPIFLILMVNVDPVRIETRRQTRFILLKLIREARVIYFFDLIFV